MPFETLKLRFFEITQVAFWDGQDAEYEFNVKCDPLKHRFFELTEVAFLDGQEAEYEFEEKCDPLKHRFPYFTHFAFGLVKRNKMSSDFLATT